MYIIAIAWIYVTVLMAATEKTITAGILTFLFYGLLPCALLLWLLGVKHRRHQQRAKQTSASQSSDDAMHDPNSAHAESDE